MRENKNNPHTPFLVFLFENNTIKIEIVEDPTKLLTFPDSTKVMAQWHGKYRSDFFQFTIKQLKAHIRKNPKQSYQEI